MITQVTRIVSRWLAHPEHGVNALIRNMPRAPEDRVARPVSVFDDVDSPEGAEGEDPGLPSPLLWVLAWSGIGIDLKAGRPVADAMPATIAVVTLIRSGEVEDMQQGRLDAGLALEAAIESLLRFNQPALSHPHGGPNWRAEGNMELLAVTRIEERRAGEGIKTMKLTGALMVTISTRRLPVTPHP